MGININELKETLSINKEDIKNNRELTNEYVVEDLMVELGYNKRKNKSVKETPDETLTWKVYDKEDSSKAKIAVKVFGLAEEFDNEELSKSIVEAYNGGFAVLVITDGANIDIYNVKSTDSANKVCSINIEEDLDDTQMAMLNAISEEGFDSGFIDNQVDDSVITDEEIIELAINSVDSLVDYMATVNSDITDDSKEHVKGVIVAKLSSSGVVSDSPAVDNDKIAEISRSFREQIEKLSDQVASSEEELKRTKELLKQKEDELNNIAGAEEKRARDLINVIEDNPDEDRSYVAVINKELIQFEDINTFVGRALQKLYEIKHYEASQYIFNTDSLKLISPGVRGDLLMNNKVYDVDLGTNNEDVALNKLRILYSHFTDVIFECKKLGTLRKKVDTTIVKPVVLKKEETTEQETSESINESKGISLEKSVETSVENEVETSVDELSNDVMKELFDDDIEDTEAEVGAEIEIEDTDEISEDTEEEISLDESEDGIDFGETDEDTSTNFDDTSTNSDEVTLEMQNVLMCSQLPQLSILLWSDENIQFNNIKYLGSSSINMSINSQNDEMTYEQILCKCIDAALALAEMNGDKDVIQRLRSTDLSTVSSFIKFFTTEYKDCTKINGTRYVVTGLENIQQTASALVDITNAINIDTSDMFLFIEGQTTSENIIEDWGYEEESIQLRDYSEYDNSNDDGAKSVAIIKGNIFGNIMITKNSLKAYKNTLGQTMAIKTNYLKYQIRPEQTNNDFSEVIRGIIIESMKNTGEPPVPVESIGNVIGEGYKLVSTDESKVGPEHIQLNANGLIIYVSMVENWQIPLSIIKTHTTLLNDSNIIIKIQINCDALRFYSEEFETSEPAFMLAVKGFVNYINSCIKE